MLKVIEQAGPSGLATNNAGMSTFNSKSYGWKILKQADQMGYIIREKAPREAGGHYFVINKLTEKGLALLKELG